MKKEKQVRAEGIREENGNQPPHSAPAETMPTLEECREAIRMAVSQLDDLLCEADGDQQKIYLLSVRQHLSPLDDYWKGHPIPASPARPEALAFNKIESAINTACGMLDLLSAMLVPIVEDGNEDWSGYAACGINSLSWDAKSDLIAAFTQLHSDYVNMRKGATV